MTFAPDGKSLWFVSDMGGQTDVWKAVPEKPAKYWWENTAVHAHAHHQRRGCGVAPAVHARQQACGLAQGARRSVVRGCGRPEREASHRVVESRPTIEFSPDGAWLVYSLSDEWFNSDIWLRPVDGSKPPYNLSRHPDNDYSPTWSPDGKLIAWTGKRNIDEVDIHYVWLRTEEEEQTKRERTMVKAREKIKKAASAPAKPGSAATKAKSAEAAPPANAGSADKPAPPPEEIPKPSPVRIDLDDIHERIHRISIPNTTESNLVWSPDSKKLAFNATVDGKRGIYTVEVPDELKPKLFAASAGGDAVWVKHDDQIVCLVEGQPTSITSKGVVSTHRFRALQSVDRAAKQRAVFDMCWRIMRDRYYDERLGNRDWSAVRAKYSDAAATAPDMRAVSELVPTHAR